MKHWAPVLICVLGLSAALHAYENDEWPHTKDIKNCPRCKAPFDAAPHPLDYRQCPKCLAALEKSSAYIKKHFKPSMFGFKGYRKGVKPADLELPPPALGIPLRQTGAFFPESDNLPCQSPHPTSLRAGLTMR